jgi:hypothetical protein
MEYSTLISDRYESCYRSAKSIVEQGETLKRLSVIVASLAVVGGFLVGGTYGLVGGLVFAIGLGGSTYSQGIQTVAQGQVLMAVTDTAVHTSPLMDDREKAELVGL